MKILGIIKKEITSHKNEWVIIACVFLFVLLRLPSLIEPYWYGDEGIYQVIGKALNSGRVLYSGIWDNKPPLLYLIYALFNGDQFLVRLFSLAIGALSVIAFFILGKKLFRKKISLYVSTLIYAFIFGSPVFEGNIANAENFMQLPILLSAIAIFHFFEKKSLKIIFLSGLFLSVAFMTKVVAVFEFTAFFIFLFLTQNGGASIKSYMNFKKLKSEMVFFLGFISVFVLFIFYFLSSGFLQDFISAVLSENIDYVGEGNSFIFPMSILFVKIAILLFALGILIINRNKFSKSALFIYLWLSLSVFSAFFSHRPYTHYILMSVIPLSYLVGRLFENKKHRLYELSVMFLLIPAIYFNFRVYDNLVGYYSNYADFILDGKKIDDYQAFFDKNTPRDYELARFIEMFGSNKKDDVFLWSDNGQIYALSDTLPPGKYIVAYHITYYNNAIDYMIEQVERVRPKLIIKTKESPELRKFLPSYVLKYKIHDASIYERED